MYIQPSTKKPSVKLANKPAPKPEEPLLPADQVNISGGKTEKRSRLLGKIGKFIAKLPKAAKHFPRFIKAVLVGSLGVGLRLAAGSLGLVGMAGLGMAGALEIRDGIRNKDKLQMLGGAGEIVRGGFTGALSLGHIFDLGAHAGTVAKVTGTLGAIQGGIHISSGLMKLAEGRAKDVKRRRIEGMLEVGMGVASLVMVTGVMTPLAVGSYAALTAARFGVVNWEKICENTVKAKDKTKELWQKVKAEFQDEPTPPQA